MRLFAFFLAASLALAVTPAATAEDGRIFPFDYRRVDLDNGFRAYLIKAGAPNQVAYVTMVRTGARDEVEAGKTGFAHFFEHMMFRGTKKYPNYDGETERFGAARNAFTSNDRTVYYLVAASDYLERIFELESDRFQNLDYSEVAFRTEAGAVLGEFQNSSSSPFRVLDRAIREAAFEKHTYRHTTIGFEADVRAMPEGYEYSKDFFGRFYRPENAVLVLVGDFDQDRAEELVKTYYRGWKSGYQAPNIPIEPEQKAPRSKTVEYRGRTLPILSFNFKAPAWSATDRQAAAVEVLGQVAFGPNSDIYRKLVIEEQRLQFLSPGFGLSRDPGLVSLTAMVTDPADVDAIEKELLAAIEATRVDLVDQKQLEATKSNLKYGFLMSLETAQDVSFALIDVVINTGGLEAIDNYYRTLEAVTAEDVRVAAEKYLVGRGMTLVLLEQAGGNS